MPTVDIKAAEALLGSIQGISGARIDTDPAGRIQGIHVLATPGLQPKQVVRNVESALRAVMDIEIDRRIVSVAQAQESDAGRSVPSPQPSNGDTPAAEAPHRMGRPEFTHFEARCPPGASTECRVSLRVAGDLYTGEGTGTPSERGRAEAAARAAVDALRQALPHCPVDLEGVKVLDYRGHRLVLVSAFGFYGRNPMPLTGAARIQRGPEEAAVLATLQATNRWAAAPPPQS